MIKITSLINDMTWYEFEIPPPVPFSILVMSNPDPGNMIFDIIKIRKYIPIKNTKVNKPRLFLNRLEFAILPANNNTVTHKIVCVNCPTTMRNDAKVAFPSKIAPNKKLKIWVI